MKQYRILAGLKVVCLLMGLVAALGAKAGNINVAAAGSGWCSDQALYVLDDCEDSNLNLNSNTFAGTNSGGFGGGIHRDWFAFDLPVLANISSASMFIWNDAANFNTVNLAAIFNLYEASDLSFSGLKNGPSLGGVSVSDADTGPSRYIQIALNTTGIAALTASLGNRFIFGGANDDGEQIFGYTSGLPKAYLTFETVPAPATISLLGLALAALGFCRRKSTSKDS